MIKDYEKVNKLGEGSYGEIFKVKKKSDNKYYVLKQISLFKLEEKKKQEIKKEAELLSKIKSKYVVKYEESFEYDDKLNIIMEYCESGDLSHYLETKKRAKVKLEEKEIWKIFIKILLGLADIHKMKILHRDLKSLNIFLKKNMDIRIGDLGIAKVLNDTLYAKTVIGTPYYLSPEICQDKPYSFKSDIWALGCILYELCTYNFPFPTENGYASLILKIINEEPEEIKNYSDDIKNLGKALLTKDFTKRPDCLTLLKMPIIRKKGQELGIIEDNKKKPSPKVDEKKNKLNLFSTKQSEDIINKTKKKNDLLSKKVSKEYFNKDLKKDASVPNLLYKSTNSEMKKEETPKKCQNKIGDRNHNENYSQTKKMSSDRKNDSNKKIIKIELLPCKDRFKKIRDIKSSRNKKVIEKESKNKKDYARKIELLPCKEKRKVNNNIIKGGNDNFLDTINQKLKVVEENLFDNNNTNNNNDSISLDGEDSIDVKPKENQLNEEKEEIGEKKEEKEEKERYKNDLVLEQSNSINLDDLINEFNELDNIEDENSNLENELENLKKKIDNYKEGIVKLIGEEKFRQVVEIYTIGIKDDSQKEKVSKDLEDFIESNSSENLDKEQMYKILSLFILECEYYRKKDQLNKII